MWSGVGMDIGAGVGAAVRMALPRTRAPEVLDAFEHTLASGTAVTAWASMGHSGMNGVMQHATLASTDAAGAVHELSAIRRPAHAQPAQDVMGWDLARRVGVDYEYPAAVMLPDGSAMAEKVAGVTATKAELRSFDQLQGILAAGYRRDFPTMSAEAAAEHARVDVELPLAIDNIIANSDRKPDNLLVDAATGAAHFIDMGLAGDPGWHQLRPYAKTELLGGVRRGSIELHPRTVAVLRANLDHAALAEVHARLVANLRAEGVPRTGTLSQRLAQNALTRVLSRPSYLQDMQARYDQILSTGRIEFQRTPLLTAPPSLPTLLRAYPAPAAGAAAGAAAGGGLLAHQLLAEDDR